MERIKEILRPYYIRLFEFKYKHTKGLRLFQNFINDYRLYKKHSLVFKSEGIKNKEADIILQYHSLEKGMLFSKMKKGFAKNRIKKLHQLLSDTEVLQNKGRSQIQIAYKVICQYYDLHLAENYDIGDIYSFEQYKFYKSQIIPEQAENFSGFKVWSKDEFYNANESSFLEFAYSRKSTREFTGTKIELDQLEKAIQLANTAPSVCNRQASNVYLLEDKSKIDLALGIQGGFTGYTKNVSQLLILTNDRKYYYTAGERNQLYIDGGVYLMNLLYALHYYKIGNCPANWGKTSDSEKGLSKIITIPESEKIICMIPIGELSNKFRTTLSERRITKENFIQLT